jgi:hypothetical protein
MLYLNCVTRMIDVGYLSAAGSTYFDQLAVVLGITLARAGAGAPCRHSDNEFDEHSARIVVVPVNLAVRRRDRTVRDRWTPQGRAASRCMVADTALRASPAVALYLRAVKR